MPAPRSPSPFLPVLVAVGLAFPAGAAPPIATADTWPAWRGDLAQTGRAPGSLDPRRLARRWTAEAGDGFVAGVAVDATRVYAGSKDGHLHAWARADGKPLWKASLGGPVEASPLVVGDVVVIGSRSGRVAAFGTADGAPRWEADLRAEITAAAAWVGPSGGHAEGVLVGAYDGRLHRLALATGAPAWTYETGSYLYASPAVTGDLAIFGGCDGFVHTVAVDTGTAVAKLPIEAYVGAAVAYDGDGFVGHFGNQVVAFDPKAATVRWTHLERAFPYLSSAALTADAVILGGRDRVVHALDRKTGGPLWWLPTNGKVDGSPVVVGPWVVVGSADGKLRVAEADTGVEVRALDVGAAISGTPAVASGWVFVGSEDGVLHAFGPRGPRP